MSDTLYQPALDPAEFSALVAGLGPLVEIAREIVRRQALLDERLNVLAVTETSEIIHQDAPAAQ